MKHLKTLTELNRKPKVKDWAIVYINPNIEQYSQKFITFINNSIGYIWKQPSPNYYLIKYFNIPKNILDDFSYSDFSDGLNTGNSILIPIIDIKYFSPNKEDLEIYITANKYNL